MPKNLSNIQLFNNKYLERLLITPTLPNDSLDKEIVPRVPPIPDESILEHADVMYKYYLGAANGNPTGWASYKYSCKYCKYKTTRSQDVFIRHLETCKGLDD